MSAFVVHNEHIRTLVWAGRHFTPYGGILTWAVPDPQSSPTDKGTREVWGTLVRQLDSQTAGTVGQLLLSENARSVNTLYRCSEHHAYDHGTPQRTDWAPVDILGALACYEYQSCESPDWTRTEAYAICQAIRSAVIRRLPGYNAAPWEITPA